MAKLTQGNLALEIRYVELDANNWVQYQVTFLYQDQPMIVDSLLKRYNEHWSRREPGAFKVNDYGGDGLIPVLQGVLDDNQPGCWLPMDPDIRLAFYPEQIFPFFQQCNWRLAYASDEVVAEEEDHAAIKELAGGRLPDDPITVIALVDLYNFGREWAYTGEGPALVMCPTRHTLRQFLTDLQAEYAEFCVRFPTLGEAGGA